MQVIQHLWRRRRVRIAGVLDQVAVDSPDDLAAIYRDYWALVYKRCYATLQDHEAASDATQDVFEQALTSFEAIRHDVVRGLMDLARTISYERKRRPTREVPLAELTGRSTPARGDDNDPAEIAERHRVLHAVWSGLSPVERRYVADKFAGFSFEEIARRRGRALGTVSSNLARAHEHARKMREPLLPGLLALAAWRRLADLSRRARSAAQNGSVAAAAQPVGSFTVSLTLAGLVAAAVPAAAVSATAPPAQRTTAMMVPTTADGGMAGTLQAGLAVADSPHAASASTLGATSRSGAGSTGTPALGRLGLPASAATETPEDTEISTATASPNYQEDHTIIALGHGNQCGCRVLLMTTDGGAIWHAQRGAPDGDQIVLSPTFPQDPTIFVGVTSGNGTTADYWTPRFGEPFTPLVGAPAGSLTLPAGFDRGDDRLIVSSSTAVWSYSWPSGAMQPLLVEPANTAPAVATAFDSPSAGVIVMTTARAFDPHRPLDAAAVDTGEAVWTCPPGQPCARDSTVSLPTGAGLVTSPRFATDHTVVAFSTGQLLASSDSGSSFTAIGLPASNAVPYDLRMASASTGTELWMTVPRGSDWELMTRPSLSMPWHEADGGNAAISSQPGRVVVVEAQRLLYVLAQGGLLCSVNGGVTWEARCPAA